MLRTKSILSAALVAALVIPATADDSAKIRSLERVYNRLKAAILTNNISVMQQIADHDFTWVDAAGRSISRSEFFAMQKSQMKNVKMISFSMKNDSYDFMGNMARVRSHSEATVEMKMNGRKMRMHGVEDAVDTWRWTKGVWKVAKVEVVYEHQGL